ncbi:hypothetical protein BLNAU_20739 [Blattamonas nauphoetae]|uniref:Uncharacterized protein n=1 Tax=Blattamonas nauphoetae TaxID=2049346 RepID=A0ABQ9WXV7_9EUKA|nr:hypothetical protein BLNAU_20739 [Blattamonas nauphoetae]
MDSEEPQSFPHPKIAIDTLTDEEIETALKVFQALEKRPSEIQQEKFKVLRKSAGHVMMSAYDGKYKTKTKEKKEKLSEKKLQQQADKSLLRSRGMMQQKRDAAEKRGLKMLTADGNEESAFGAEVLPYKGNGTVELPPVALPPPIETPVCLKFMVSLWICVFHFRIKFLCLTNHFLDWSCANHIHIRSHSMLHLPS